MPFVHDQARRRRVLAYCARMWPGAPAQASLMKHSNYSKGRISQLFNENLPFKESASRALAIRCGEADDYFERDHPEDMAALNPIEGDSEFAGRPRYSQGTPVVGEARMGSDGYYEELQYPKGHGDGFVVGYTGDPNAYALRVKGDSMHPAIRHGSFVIVSPNGRCTPGEFVAIALTDGRKMVKELIIERPTEVVLLSVNGGARETVERANIEHMHPVVGQVPASQWRPAID